MDFYGYGLVWVANLTDATCHGGLQVGCDGLCMVRVVKMPACDIALFRIFSMRIVAIKFRSRIGVGSSLKIIRL